VSLYEKETHYNLYYTLYMCHCTQIIFIAIYCHYAHW